MFVLLSYDVEAVRTQMFKKIAEKFLNRIQNSVFEGHITESQLMRLEKSIEDVIKDHETLFIWVFPHRSYVKEKIYGSEKRDDTFI